MIVLSPNESSSTTNVVTPSNARRIMSRDHDHCHRNDEHYRSTKTTNDDAKESSTSLPTTRHPQSTPSTLYDFQTKQSLSKRVSIVSPTDSIILANDIGDCTTNTNRSNTNDNVALSSSTSPPSSSSISLLLPMLNDDVIELKKKHYGFITKEIQSVIAKSKTKYTSTTTITKPQSSHLFQQGYDDDVKENNKNWEGFDKKSSYDEIIQAASILCKMKSDCHDDIESKDTLQNLGSSLSTMTYKKRNFDFINEDKGARSTHGHGFKKKKMYPSSLAMENDSLELNSLHCYVRSELLELFVVTSNDDVMQSSSSCSPTSRRKIPGRVGLRCIHCKSQINDTTKPDFFPKSLHGLYREVCTWQRVHFQHCPHVPKACRNKYKHLKVSDKTRGKTKYWETSARELGLVDAFHVSGEHDGICFRDDIEFVN